MHFFHSQFLFTQVRSSHTCVPIQTKPSCCACRCYWLSVFPLNQSPKGPGPYSLKLPSPGVSYSCFNQAPKVSPFNLFPFLTPSNQAFKLWSFVWRVLTKFPRSTGPFILTPPTKLLSFEALSGLFSCVLTKFPRSPGRGLSLSLKALSSLYFHVF